MRVSAAGTWTFEIDPEFKLLGNGESLQAVHGKRVVYVSSLRVDKPDIPARAAQIRATAAKRLGSGDRVSHVTPLVQGDATISQNGDAWRLHGIMCADGTVATCVIDFPSSDLRVWAVAVWKSLSCDGGAA